MADRTQDPADSEAGGAEADEGLSLDDLGSLALGELGRRLRNPEAREEIPGTGLLQLSNTWLKIKEREAAKPAEEENEPDLLDELGALPAARQRTLIDAEIARLRERVSALESRRDLIEED